MKFCIIRNGHKKPIGFDLISESPGADDSFIKALPGNLERGTLKIYVKKSRLIVQNGSWLRKESFEIPKDKDVPYLRNGFGNKSTIRLDPIGRWDLRKVGISIMFEKKK